MSNVAEEAAKKAVHETFMLLNVDVNDVESRERFQANMRFMHDLRKTSEATKSAIFKTIIVLVVTGICAAIWKGLDIANMP